MVRTGLWSRVSALECLFVDCSEKCTADCRGAVQHGLRVSAVILDSSFCTNCTILSAQCGLLLNGMRLTAASRHARSSSTPMSCVSLASTLPLCEVDGDIITVGVERSCHADVVLQPSPQPADFRRPGPVVELAQDLHSQTVRSSLSAPNASVTWICCSCFDPADNLRAPRREHLLDRRRTSRCAEVILAQALGCISMDVKSMDA